MFLFGSNKQKEKVFQDPTNFKKHASQTEIYIVSEFLIS